MHVPDVQGAGSITSRQVSDRAPASADSAERAQIFERREAKGAGYRQDIEGVLADVTSRSSIAAGELSIRAVRAVVMAKHSPNAPERAPKEL